MQMTGGPLSFKRSELDALAHRIGKRFLKNDDFLDDLCDALDGYDVKNDLSETEDDEKPLVGNEKEQVVSDGQEPKANKQP